MGNRVNSCKLWVIDIRVLRVLLLVRVTHRLSHELNTSVIFIAPSAPPRNVMPTITTSRSITVTWDTITCIERNGIITSYTVEFGPSGNPTMRTGITELTFTASTNGLTPFTNYTFQVAGVNSVNTGMYSNIISITTDEDCKHVTLFY